MTAGTETTAGTGRTPVVALYAANAFSLVGNQLTSLAVVWFVLVTTGSAVKTGLVGFAAILAAIVATFFGGTLVDRLGFKRASIVSDLASGATVASIPLLYHTVGLAFWQLLALVFLGALLDGPGVTARSALLPDLAQLAGQRLERATSTVQVIERGSRLVGAPLSGALVALIGPSNVLWIDAATFTVSALLVAVAVPARRARAEEGEREARGSYFAELRDGLRFIRADRLILAIGVTVMLTNCLDAAWGMVVLPVYAREAFGSAVALGLLLGASGGGAVVGALIFGAIGHRLPRRATYIWAFVFTALRFWVLALYPPLGLALAVYAISSIGAGPLNPILHTVQYERVPAELRGRVFGAITAGAYVAMPLGTLAGGWLVEGIGVLAALIGIAAAYLAVTLGMLAVPALREMDAVVPAGGQSRVGATG